MPLVQCSSTGIIIYYVISVDTNLPILSCQLVVLKILIIRILFAFGLKIYNNRNDVFCYRESPSVPSFSNESDDDLKLT